MSLSTEISILNDEIQNLRFDDATSQHSLEGWKEKIAKINKFNSVDKYKVVFIGRPGSGKTTAICNWLDLIHIENGTDPRKSHDLLSTGSGNTTVAEVRLRQVQDGPSRIRLDYLSTEAQIGYIKDFASGYYCACKETAEDSGEEDETQPLRHTEIDRMIRNMAGLETIPLKSEKERWDLVTSKVTKYKSLEDFQKEILRRINLDNRNATEISFEGGNFRDWLYQTFNDINYGKNKKCSIPKCIHLDINVNDLDMHLPGFVSEIVDTLGLDTEASARLDLQKFMVEDDSICILVDEINNPPSVNLRNVIKNSFAAGSEYLKEKVALYIRWKEGELENVPDADHDSEKGLRLKQDSLNTCVVNYAIPYRIENTRFFNSKEAYLVDEINTYKDGKRMKEQVLNYIDDLAKKLRNDINNWFGDILANLKAVLRQDALVVKTEVERLIGAQELNDKKRVDAALQKIRSEIFAEKDNWQVRFNDTRVAQKMADSLAGIHWATIKAMNRRFGGYETYRIDVYTEFMQAGKNEFTEKANALRNNLIKLFASDDKNVQTIISGYVQRINNLIANSISEFGIKLLDWLLCKSEMYPQNFDNSFWPDMQGIYGRGYKTRVLDKYENSLDEKRFDIAAMYNQEYNLVMSEIISWLP